MEGQLCYRADIEKLNENLKLLEKEYWEKEKYKMRTSGFMFILDYNEDRSLDMVLNDIDDELKVDDKTLDSTLFQKKTKISNDLKPLIYLETIGKNCKAKGGVKKETSWG